MAPPVRSGGRPTRRGALARDRAAQALMLAPAFLVILAVIGYPLVYSLWVSFVEFKGGSAGAPFVGLRNYRVVIEDEIAQQSVFQTLALAGIACALELVFGLALALFVARRFRGWSVLTVVCLLPLFASPAIAVHLWRLVLRAGVGPVDFLFTKAVGHPLGADWTVTPWAYGTILLVDVWQWTPFMFLILLVGLILIPTELREAAAVDGARPLDSFRSITLPLIAPFVSVAVVIRFIDAAKLFEVPYVLTGGNPDLDMQTASYYLFQNGFISFFQDFAAAGSWLLLLALMAVALPVVYLLRGGGTR